MGQIQWIGSLVMVALFSIAILGFALNFAIDNDAPIDLADDPEINTLYTQSQEDMSGFGDNAEDTYKSIVNSTIDPGGFTTISGGQFAITGGSVIDVTKNILLVGYTKIFGTGTGFGLFITALLGMIVFVTILLLWKTWAGRNPE